MRLSWLLVGVFFRVWCRLRIEGGEHIPTQGGVLLVSNHLSLLDALLIPYVVMAVQGVQIVLPAPHRSYSALLGCLSSASGP
jgi:hypothetical protein